MKQTLKIGDKYRVIKTNKIITVEEIFNRHSFYGSDNNWHNLELGELQLIKPKTKKVKKYKYSRKEIVKMIKTKCFFGHNESKAVRWLLATQPKTQPIKEDKKEWKPCDCPKGGIDGDGMVCDKCGGTEWVNVKSTPPPLNMKIKLGKHIFQTYPVKETDIPNKWIYFEKIRLFGKTIGCYWLIK